MFLRCSENLSRLSIKRFNRKIPEDNIKYTPCTYIYVQVPRLLKQYKHSDRAFGCDSTVPHYQPFSIAWIIIRFPNLNVILSLKFF